MDLKEDLLIADWLKSFSSERKKMRPEWYFPQMNKVKMLKINAKMQWCACGARDS